VWFWHWNTCLQNGQGFWIYYHQWNHRGWRLQTWRLVHYFIIKLLHSHHTLPITPHITLHERNNIYQCVLSLWYCYSTPRYCICVMSSSWSPSKLGFCIYIVTFVFLCCWYVSMFIINNYEGIWSILFINLNPLWENKNHIPLLFCWLVLHACYLTGWIDMI